MSLRNMESFNSPIIFETEEDEGECCDANASLERFLVKELSREPFFLTNLALSSFNYLTSTRLFEILMMVLEQIDKERSKIISEQKNELLKFDEIQEFLKFLKYDPSESDELRIGLASGNPNVYVPVLAWLLGNLQILRTRCYLAKFLIKVQIPTEYWCDCDVAELYELYEESIEKFKRLHKEKESIKKDDSLAKVIEDSSLIQADIDSISRKIQTIKSKVVKNESVKEILRTLKTLRTEKLKNAELDEVHSIEIERWKELNEEIERLVDCLNDLTHANNSVNPIENIIEREEQEKLKLIELLNIKIPGMISKGKLRNESYKKILEFPPFHPSELVLIRENINEIEKEIEVIEKQNAKRFGSNLKLTKELMAGRKKVEMIQIRRNKLEKRVEKLKNELNDKRIKIQKKLEIINLQNQREIQNQAFVESLRHKSKLYKEKKTELAALRAKLIHLKSICENESEKNPQILNELEDGNLDDKKNKLLRKQAELVGELHNRIESSENGNELKRLFQALECASQEYGRIRLAHANIKKITEFPSADPSLNSQLETEIEELKNEVQKFELEETIGKIDIAFKEIELNRAEECVNGGRPEFKERLVGSIVEQERHNRILCEEDLSLESILTKNVLQTKYFSDLLKLLNEKKEYANVLEFEQKIFHGENDFNNGWWD